MDSTRTPPARQAAADGRHAGRFLAERLGLKIIGTEGHDLKCPCIACDSSDAMRVHEKTGVSQCYSCNSKWSPYRLAEDVIGHEAAIALMVEAGIFEPSKGNHTTANKAAPKVDPIAEVARLKHVTPESLKRYGATAKGRQVVFPMFGPDGSQCSTFTLSANNGKGLNEKGKPTGLFLPADTKPEAGQTWQVVEGVKDAAALADLGFEAVGLPGNRLKDTFADMFRGVNVIVIPDADKPGQVGAEGTAKLLYGVAESVRIAKLPVEVRDSGGLDVRDVLQMEGGKAKLLAALENAQSVDANGKPEENPLPPRVSLRELAAAHPKLRPPVIHGLLRRGETANLVAIPKQGKSWLASGLAICVATGTDWLDTFACVAGRVLLIDGELHPETIAHRLPAVGEAMGLSVEQLDNVDVWPLRGQCTDLVRLGGALAEIKPGTYDLVVLDAWYRFLPPGVSENDNAAIMSLYNLIDSYTAHLEAAWVNVHHASKGDQSGKGITDVGSGAGSQSRAADTHLIVRPHATDGVAVLDAVVRSWAPIEPLAIRWTFPVWTPDPDADPARLGSATAKLRQESRETDRRELVSIAMKVGASTKTNLRGLTGWGGDRFNRAFATLEADGIMQPVTGHGKQGQRAVLWNIREDEEC